MGFQDVFDTLEAKVKVSKHNLSPECHCHWSAILPWPKSMLTLNLCLRFKYKSSCKLCCLTALSIISTLLHWLVRRYMGSQKLVSGFLPDFGCKGVIPSTHLPTVYPQSDLFIKYRLLIHSCWYILFVPWLISPACSTDICDIHKSAGQMHSALNPIVLVLISSQIPHLQDGACLLSPCI